jgi:hypothetical protein
MTDETIECNVQSIAGVLRKLLQVRGKAHKEPTIEPWLVFEGLQ